MGIKNFGKFVKCSPNCVKSVNYNQFSGQTWAIDASIFCHRFAHNSQAKRPNSHIDGFYQMFNRLLRFNIHPVMVFDGKTPIIKQHTVDERTRIKQKNIEKAEKMRHELKDLVGFEIPVNDIKSIHDKIKGIDNEEEIKQKIESLTKAQKNIINFQPHTHDDIRNLCQLMNIPFYKANGEADALCAKLYKMGKVQAIMSEDSDMLLYGGGKLMRKIGWSNDFELLDMDILLAELGITHEQFVDLAILCGTDYTSSTIGGLGPVTALQYIKEGKTIEDILSTIQTEGKHRVPTDGSFGYSEAREWIKSACASEPDVDVNVFKCSDIQGSQLKQLMTEKCRYKNDTITKHLDILHKIYGVDAQTIVRPRIKVKLRTNRV